MITTAEILAYMKSGKTFSMKVCSYDRSRKKGGKVREFPEAILTQAGPIASRPPTSIEKKQAELARIRKNPHHRSHYTRNITILANGRKTSIVEKIHPPLILEFNGDSIVVP